MVAIEAIQSLCYLNLLYSLCVHSDGFGTGIEDKSDSNGEDSDSDLHEDVTLDSSSVLTASSEEKSVEEEDFEEGFDTFL